MRGTFASTVGGAPSGREEWSLDREGGRRRLRATGTALGGEPLAWDLDARFKEAGPLDSMELQVRPAARPQEVTTVALRCFGGRAFGTAIPPGGVPERFETRFEDGALVRAFSAALDGISVGFPALKVGHGRRLVVVALDGDGLTPRIEDAMLLARSRERAPTPGGEEWCVTYELRWAGSPGRPETVAVVTRAGVVVKARRTSSAGPRDTRLLALEP